MVSKLPEKKPDPFELGLKGIKFPNKTDPPKVIKIGMQAIESFKGFLAEVGARLKPSGQKAMVASPKEGELKPAERFFKTQKEKAQHLIQEQARKRQEIISSHKVVPLGVPEEVPEGGGGEERPVGEAILKKNTVVVEEEHKKLARTIAGKNLGKIGRFLKAVLAKIGVLKDKAWNKDSKKVIDEVAYAEKMHKNVPQLISGPPEAEVVVTPYKVVEKQVLLPPKTKAKEGIKIKRKIQLGPDGKPLTTLVPVSFQGVVPTSVRHADPENSNHLINCYVTVVNGVAVVRTGVIDTKEKAEEFLAVVKAQYRKLSEEYQKTHPGWTLPLRIVSNQLNSPETESKLINSQHRWMIHLNRKLQADPELSHGKIIHINTPANAFYFWTKKLGRVGRAIFKGEEKSKEMNLEGWATYTQWMFENIDKMALSSMGLENAVRNIEFKKMKVEESFLKLERLKEISEEITQIQKKLKSKKLPEEERLKLQNKLDELTKEKEGIGDEKEVEESLKQQRAGLKESLINVYTRFKALRQEVALSLKDSGEEEKPSLGELESKLGMMIALLGSQLDIPEAKRISRGQELQLLDEVSSYLGVIFAINCRSGLDRTGFRYAAKLALEQLKMLGYDTKEMVARWDSLTEKMNQQVHQLGFERFQESKEGAEKEQMKTIMRYRELVLENLIRIGLPITEISTGLIGLKWHKGLQENLHPLSFIPPYYKKADGELVKLVNYNEDGSVKGLTKEGQELLTQLSSYRGG